MTTSTSQLRKRIEDLDTQIADQRRVLLDLEQSRDDLEQELNETATFDVLTLPVEVTIEIFMWFQQIGYAAHIPHSLYSSAADIVPLVCRTWRNVALATPMLWSVLGVDVENGTELMSEPLLVRYIDKWLGRAKQCPLSLEFISNGDNNFTSDRFRELIWRWAPQIRSLRLWITIRDIRLLELDSTNFPMLEKADVMYIQAEYHADLGPVNLFQNAPLLYDLRLDVEETTIGMLPWSQLTKVDGTLSDLELLLLAPNLTELACEFVPDDDASFSLKEHSNLKRLTISAAGFLVNGDILQYLTLPALLSLDIARAAETTHTALASFLKRSSPPLVSISLRGNDACVEEWDEFMPLIDRTFESVEIREMEERNAGYFLDDARFNPYPKIKSLTINYPGKRPPFDLVQFLYGLEHVRSFKFLWNSDPFFLEQTVSAECGGEEITDTVRKHISYSSSAGMDIYIGTESQNYAERYVLQLRVGSFTQV
ncbi:hypothetical protein R3P38DRAFT_3171730 [Favolaschia claudopus]|uniref:F-box domain-containing protein n=1 Tax=Favolaschia claudopus TaxID=2862362 RepID=A0AAW0DP55_9AGAR